MPNIELVVASFLLHSLRTTPIIVALSWRQNFLLLHRSSHDCHQPDKPLDHLTTVKHTPPYLPYCVFSDTTNWTESTKPDESLRWCLQCYLAAATFQSGDRRVPCHAAEGHCSLGGIHLCICVLSGGARHEHSA